LLSILIGILVLNPSLITTKTTAVIVFIYGLAIAYLACILRVIYLQFPEAENNKKGSVELSTDKAMILLLSIFMLLLGLFLIPVSLGLFPFSANAQLGLLMVIFAIQMLSLGNTPIGVFPRTWVMILLGFLFASLGIISCIIPGILVYQLTILVGLLNIIGGIISLRKLLVPLWKKPTELYHSTPPILVKLFTAQLALALLSILFGTSMLISNLIPGLIVGVVLSANGCVLLYLFNILILLDRIENNEVISETE
ncbi:MAG: hypothetical protein PHS21_02520, partial [Atribacterota bacterium]|nr:hypothetical protein [Atribacterota bacterium]